MSGDRDDRSSVSRQRGIEAAKFGLSCWEGDSFTADDRDAYIQALVQLNENLAAFIQQPDVLEFVSNVLDMEVQTAEFIALSDGPATPPGPIH